MTAPMEKPAAWPDDPRSSILALCKEQSRGLSVDDHTMILIYEQRLARAALSWLRLAVEKLKRHNSHYECEDCWYSCATICCDDGRKSDVCDCGAQGAIEALALIGELPKESE